LQQISFRNIDPDDYVDDFEAEGRPKYLESIGMGRFN
jgi:hypothetical protein